MIETVRVLVILGLVGMGFAVLVFAVAFIRMWYNNHVEHNKE